MNHAAAGRDKITAKNLHVLFAPETAPWTTFVVSNYLSRHFAQIKSHILVDDAALASSVDQIARHTKLLVVSPKLNDIVDRCPSLQHNLADLMRRDPAGFVCVDTTAFVDKSDSARGERMDDASSLLWTDELMNIARNSGVELRHYDGDASETAKRGFIKDLESLVVDVATKSHRQSTRPKKASMTIKTIREMIVSPNTLPTEGDVRFYIILHAWQLNIESRLDIFIDYASDDGDNDENGNKTFHVEAPFYEILNPFNVVVRSPPMPKGAAVVRLRQGDRSESANVLFESAADRMAKAFESAVKPLELLAESLGISPSTATEVDRRLGGKIAEKEGEKHARQNWSADRPPKSADIVSGQGAETRRRQRSPKDGTTEFFHPNQRFPSLLHFCAHFGLVNSSAALSTQPGFVANLRMPNVDLKTPIEMAKDAGHRKLADFFADFLDVSEKRFVQESSSLRAETAENVNDDDEDDDVCTSMDLVDLEKYGNRRRGEENWSEINRIETETDESTPIPPALPPKTRSNREARLDENSIGRNPDVTSKNSGEEATASCVVPVNVEIKGTRKEMNKIVELLRNGDIVQSQFISIMDEWNAKTNNGRNFTAGEEEFATAVKVITRIKSLATHVSGRRGGSGLFGGGGGNRITSLLPKRGASRSGNNSPNAVGGSDPNIDIALQAASRSSSRTASPSSGRITWRKNSNSPALHPQVSNLDKRASCVSSSSGGSYNSAGYASNEDSGEEKSRCPPVEPIGARASRKASGVGNGSCGSGRHNGGRSGCDRDKHTD